jgi:CubicO group peptidase (beta-lactamase class C family)
VIRKTAWRIRTFAVTLWVAAIWITATAVAGAASDPPEHDMATAAAPPTAAVIAGLPAFIDGAVMDAMRRDHIAGVDVAVVNASAVLLAKGYGVAALNPVREMNADTLTRVGSISKTVVWVALMQLVEQRRIALDDPINRYLPPTLQVPDDGFVEPIRIKHLMTHTAGFEETILGHLEVNDARLELPVATYLARYRPRRVLPPGKIAVYCNYGAALAGMIVTQVSKLPWELYAEQRVLRPLGMHSATFRENLPQDLAIARGLPQPMPAADAAHLSEGFRRQNAQLAQAPPEYITHYAPAGALVASANDMTVYMQAFLDPKRFAVAGVLSEQSVHTMIQPSFSNAQGFGAIYHGLFQFPFPDSQLAIGHDGDTRYHHAIMLIVPKMDLGIFVGVNTEGGLRLIEQLPYLVGMYLQGQKQRPEIHTAVSNGAGNDVEGTYRPLRRAYYRTERAFLDLGTTSVQKTTDGDLLVSGLTPDTVRYTPEDGGTYREVAGPNRIAFRQEHGHLLLLDPTGSNPLERIGFFAGAQWLLIIIALTHLTAAWGTVQAVRDLRARDRLPWVAAWSIVPCLWLASLVVAWIGVAPWLGDTDALLMKYPGTLFPVACWMFFLAALATVGTALLIGPTRPPWRARRWLFTTLATLVFASCAATFRYWGLLGFSGW